MGRLVVQEIVTADGFAADYDGNFTFTQKLEGPVEAWDRHQFEWLDGVSAMALGARTYEIFQGFWPTPASAGEIIADKLNALDRYVFSTTLREAPWGSHGECRIESGDAAEAIQRIKREASGAVVVWGSLTLAASLFAAGEVDELRLLVTPVVIGAGRGFLPERPQRLALTGTTTFDGGMVELVYDVENA
ncbi:dihydrofolate reductase family protein [Sinomonas sp. JGH33]|uniref:Dihydrofolate reductase family protein n=1 Tax=Sinomonas terricola TaxID=3110330 RepID=A0ABU5T2M2_9MICC|nr:dihydrofolate reductase family protein [Sinomonas sp. JGH33]MEA5453904.1 dihydrofolate reductase family protein [Sinomonas sp. JGH33]